MVGGVATFRTIHEKGAGEGVIRMLACSVVLVVRRRRAGQARGGQARGGQARGGQARGGQARLRCNRQLCASSSNPTPETVYLWVYLWQQVGARRPSALVPARG